MKYAKKLVMIPEDEYMILLSLAKGKNTMTFEKAKLDSAIHSNLENKNIPEDLKMKKHNWLYKQRRKMQYDIENKPKKVILEKASSTAPSIPPYLNIGVAKTEPKEEVGEQKHIIMPSGIPNTGHEFRTAENEKEDSAESVESFHTAIAAESTPENDIPEKTHSATRRRTTSAILGRESNASKDEVYPYIDNKYRDRLLNYLDSNREKFGINDDNTVNSSSTSRRKVANSNFGEIVDFMANRKISNKRDNYTAPQGYRILYERLKTDPFFINLYKKSVQSGHGVVLAHKRKILPIKAIKTKNIKRGKSRLFRPKIWVKL